MVQFFEFDRAEADIKTSSVKQNTFLSNRSCGYSVATKNEIANHYLGTNLL